MSEIKIPIIIYSHSSYSDVWPMVIGQFELYMPKSEIILFTDSDPLKGNYRPVFYDNKLNYNERVIQCLQKINDEVILFTHEDMPLYSPPNFEILGNYISHIHSGKADSIKLIFAGWHFKSKKLEFDETLSKNKLSRFSIQPTLIKPNTLVKILKRYPSSNLWEFLFPLLRSLFSIGINFGNLRIQSSTLDFALGFLWELISEYIFSRSRPEFFLTPMIMTLLLFCGTPNSSAE